MDFARETRGHTARAACGHTSSRGQRVRQLPELLEDLFEDTAAIPFAHSTRGQPTNIGEHML